MFTAICQICQEEFERKSNAIYCGPDCKRKARWIQSQRPEFREKKQEKQKLKKREQRAEDPEKYRAVVRKSRTKHREQRDEDNKQWHAEHPEYRREYIRKYREQNPGSRKQEHIQYYQANKEQVYARTKARRQANPSIMQEYNSRRRALLANAEGNWTKQQFKELCESVDYHCSYCHKRFDRLTPDHMTPLIRGGSNDITNITPACLSCNSSKQDKTVLEFISYIKIF